MPSVNQAMRYQTFGPNMNDALIALQRERDRIQKCIDALKRCVEMGLLGCQHEQDATNPDSTQQGWNVS